MHHNIGVNISRHISQQLHDRDAPWPLSATMTATKQNAKPGPFADTPTEKWLEWHADARTNRPFWILGHHFWTIEIIPQSFDYNFLRCERSKVRPVEPWLVEINWLEYTCWSPYPYLKKNDAGRFPLSSHFPPGVIKDRRIWWNEPHGRMQVNEV